MIFDNFVKIFFSYTQKCLRIRQLDIRKKTKEFVKKKSCERYQNFSEERKNKNDNVVANDMKISQK